MRIRLYISLGFFALLVFYGCGGSSEVEMKQAKQAMNHALSVHADILVPKEFQEAQKTWEHAQAAAKEGKTSNAKVLYASAKIYFSKTALIAKTNHEALSRQLKDLQLVIDSNFDQVKSDLSKKKLSPQDHDQVKAIAAEIVEDKASINKLAAQENLIKAVAMAKGVLTKIYHAQLILAGQKPYK